MPSIWDRLFGRKTTEEQKKEEVAKVSEEAARKRREELAAKQKEAEDARKRFEEAEKARLAAQAKGTAAATDASVAAAVATLGTDRTYVVKSGDSLSKIAKEFLGDAKRWPEIYEANKQLIGDNPNLIHPGQKLRIP